MEKGWDLQAVVRGCRGEAATSSAAADPFSCSSLPSLHEHEGDDVLLYFPDTSCSKSALQELLELCEPFLRRRTPQADPPPRPRLPVQSTRSKRRKNQLKKVVCQVPADGMSADIWAWRKYGQKPIKGSPFPRGYYRCSSSKGCPARKQVERSRADPGTFVITYTAEHNHPAPTHRNSLAGSTRHKTPPAAPKVNSRSPIEEKKDEEEPDEPEEDEEEGVLMVSDMELLGEDDMMFLDLNGGGEESPEGFSTVFSSSSSWVESGAAAAAAGGH